MTEPSTRFAGIDWDIRREGRAWSVHEVSSRYDLAPTRIELIDGRLLWSDEDRLLLLGLLLENVGADRAVRLGNPEVWRAALADLEPAG